MITEAQDALKYHKWAKRSLSSLGADLVSSDHKARTYTIKHYSSDLIFTVPEGFINSLEDQLDDAYRSGRED